MFPIFDLANNPYYTVSQAKRIAHENDIVAWVTPSLPDLEGSEKQIMWATDIRVQMIKQLDRFIYTELYNDSEYYPKEFAVIDLDSEEATNAFAAEVFEDIMSICDASWFIDNRGTPQDAFKRCVRDLLKDKA